MEFGLHLNNYLPFIVQVMFLQASAMIIVKSPRFLVTQMGHMLTRLDSLIYITNFLEERGLSVVYFYI